MNASGRDPLRPFGQQATPQPQPTQVAYEPPRAKNMWWLVVLALVVIAAVLAAFSLKEDPVRAPVPTATSTPDVQQSPGKQPETAAPPSVLATNSIPFATADGSGIWAINAVRWDDSSVVINTTITVQRGSLDFSFYAFDVATSSAIENTYEDLSNPLLPTMITEGNSLSGNLRFVVPRGKVTVVLAQATGRQITALMVRP